MAELISKSEQKRIYKQVEELAREVADLSDKDLKKFPGGVVLHEEILATRGLKGGSKNRQIKYLAKLLRQGPLDEIYLYVTQRKGSRLHAKKQFHEAERIRDTLINEAVEAQQQCLFQQIPFEPNWTGKVIPQILNDYPGTEENEIRRVIYQYVVTRNKLHYRELFRVMKAAVELKERLEKAGKKDRA
jgi:ribosome-associated protein